MRRILFQGIVRAVLMVIAHVIMDEPAKMFLVQRNDIVEELAATTSYPPLRDAILPGCLRARPLGLQPRGLQKRQDGSIELRIAVQNHVTVWTSVREGLAQLLDDPLHSRMWSHVEVQNPAAAVLDDKKAVEQLERYRRHSEEIERRDHLTVILEKGKPTPTRIGTTPRSPQVPSYGSF